MLFSYISLKCTHCGYELEIHIDPINKTHLTCQTCSCENTDEDIMFYPDESTLQ